MAPPAPGFAVAPPVAAMAPPVPVRGTVAPPLLPPGSATHMFEKQARPLSQVWLG